MAMEARKALQHHPVPLPSSVYSTATQQTTDYRGRGSNYGQSWGCGGSSTYQGRGDGRRTLSSPTGQDVTCQICSRIGHSAALCYYRFQSSSSPCAPRPPAPPHSGHSQQPSYSSPQHLMNRRPPSFRVIDSSVSAVSTSPLAASFGQPSPSSAGCTNNASVGYNDNIFAGYITTSCGHNNSRGRLNNYRGGHGQSQQPYNYSSDYNTHYPYQPPPNEWIPDTGATHHMTNNSRNLNLQVEPYKGPERINIGDGSGGCEWRNDTTIVRTKITRVDSFALAVQSIEGLKCSSV